MKTYNFENGESAIKFTKVRKIADEGGSRRLLISTALLALVLFVNAASWSIPVFRNAEAILYDLRSTVTRDKVVLDDRIVILTYDEQTVYESGKHSPLDRKILANTLLELKALRPKAIGLDFVYDQETEGDDQLIDALETMTIPISIAFVNDEKNNASGWQDPKIIKSALAFEKNYHGRIENTYISKVGVVLPLGIAGVIRKWPAAKSEKKKLLAQSLAGSLESSSFYGGPLMFREPEDDNPDGIFLKISLSQFLDREVYELRALRRTIEDRIVLIGLDVPGRDKFKTSQSAVSFEEPMAGVEVHAHMLAQILDGNHPTVIHPVLIWLSCMVIMLMAGLTAFSNIGTARQTFWITIQILFALILPYLLHALSYDTLNVPAFGWLANWFLAFMILTGLAKSIGQEKRLFAQGALGKYLPDEVAKEIIANPAKLNLSGEKKEIFALFSDLEGFTKLSHAVEPEVLASLLNQYLQMLTDTVLAHGGTIDKFVGDAVVAFWGAPISHDDDAKRAARCAVAVWKAGEEFRNNVSSDLPRIGMTRVGLHFGEAVVGNFGSNDRIQYTALGDAMNTAARLESANKQTGTGVLISKEVQQQVPDMAFRTLGRVTLSGRSTPVEIFEPVDGDQKDFAEWLNGKYSEYDMGNQEKLQEIREKLHTNPNDFALSMFADRLSETNPGGSYEFGSK